MAAWIPSPVGLYRHAGFDSSPAVGGKGRLRRLWTRLFAAGAAVLGLTVSAAANRIKTTTQPVIVELTVGSLNDALGTSQSSRREEIIKNLAGQVIAQAQQHPGQLLSIRLADASLTFQGAADDIQKQILTAKGTRAFAQSSYESEVAALLSEIITATEQQTGDIPISVLGLPIEGASRLDAGAKSANARYRGVLNQTDAFVSSRSVFATGGSASELMTLKTSLSEAFRLANGRSIVYRSGNEWRLVTTPLTATITASVQKLSPKLNPGSPTQVASDTAPSSTASEPEAQVPATQNYNAPSPTYPPDAIAQLQAAWGTSNPQWDLNGDGIVGASDLALLLAILSGESDQAPDVGICFETDDTTILPPPIDGSVSDSDSDNNDDEPDDGGGSDPAGAGQWSNPPAEYVVGSGANIDFTVSTASPPGVNVVFQTWSTVTNTIEAPQPDYNSPFVYLSSSLNQVTIGPAEIQAIVRDGDNQVIDVITHQLTFVEPGGSGGWDGSDDDDVQDDGLDPDGDQPSDSGDNGENEPSGGDDGSIDDGGSGGGDNGGGGGGGIVMPWGDPDAPSPSPVITAIDTSGMAPFTAHVHGLESQLGAGDALTAYYQWDFGDPSGQYNQLVGWNAAHIYDQPGTYTITLTITNEAGRQEVTTTEVTVSQDTRMEFYVAANGNDSNNGLSPDSPVQTFTRALQLLSNDSRVLFRRGDTFDVDGVPGDVTKHNWVFGAYGSASQKPRLRWTGGTGDFPVMLPMHGTYTSDVVIEDIKFDSAYSWEDYDERNIVDAIRPAGTNITVRNCAFGNVTMGINSERDPQGVLGMNNAATTENGLRAYLFWVEGSDHTYLGNEAVISTHEHNVRLAYPDRVLLFDNTLYEDEKRTIWVMTGEYCYVVGNRLNCGRLTIGPNHALGDPADRFKWCVVERNVIDHTDTNTNAVEVEHGALHVSIRNNIIKTYGKTSIEIDGWDEEMARRAKDVRVLSNTAINDGSTGRFCSVATGAEDLYVANNLYVSPELATGSYGSAIMFVLEPDLSEFSAIENNCWPVPDDFEWVGDGYHYLWPYWSNAGGFQNVGEWSELTETTNDVYENITLDENYAPEGGAAIGMSERVPGVYTDLHGVVRPVETWVAGAVEPADGN